MNRPTKGRPTALIRWIGSHRSCDAVGSRPIIPYVWMELETCDSSSAAEWTLSDFFRSDYCATKNQDDCIESIMGLYGDRKRRIAASDIPSGDIETDSPLPFKLLRPDNKKTARPLLCWSSQRLGSEGSGSCFGSSTISSDWTAQRTSETRNKKKTQTSTIDSMANGALIWRPNHPLPSLTPLNRLNGISSLFFWFNRRIQFVD